MKNNKIIYGIISAIVLIVVDLVVFVCVKDFTAVRYVNILFLNISLICALVFSFISGNKDEIYMNYSKIPIVYTYSIIDFIISAVLIAIDFQNMKITLGIQIVLLGIFVVSMLLNKMSDNSAKNSINQDTKNADSIKEMTDKLENILNSIDDRNLYRKVEKAYDDIKNSKLNIDNDTSSIDSNLMNEINTIEVNIRNNAEIDDQISNIHKLVFERNKMK